MANWAWPHTPNSHMARIILSGGPFDGEEVGFLPPDTANPAQIVWTGWFSWGFTAYLYEWRGGTRMDQGRTAALVYEPVIEWRDDMPHQGRRIPADDIPPLIAETVEVWADGADLIRSAFDVPAELLWPGV